MLSEDKCYELWHQKGEIVDMIRHIYTMGYNDAIKLKKGAKRGKQAVKQEPQKAITKPFQSEGEV